MMVASRTGDLRDGTDADQQRQASPENQYSDSSTTLGAVYRALTTLIVAALLGAGCSFGASAKLAAAPTTLVPITALPSTTVPEPTTTTTEPPDTTPPSIHSTLHNGDAVEWYRGDVVVTTEPDAKLKINNETVDLDENGSATVPIVNAPGENTVLITATDRAGNTSQERVTYTFGARDGWIATIGDSIMASAREEIEKRLGNNVVDATGGRQFLEAPPIVADLARRENPPQVVVVGLGTNGPVQARHFDQVMETIGPETLVAFINVSVPRNWETTSNSELASGVERFDNAILVDWFAEADDGRGFFSDDGYHLRPAGDVALAVLIADAIFPGLSTADSRRPSQLLIAQIRGAR